MTELNERYLAAKRRLFDMVLEQKLNPMQREAVCTVNGPLLVLAGAGSGKTTVLVHRIAHLIKYGNAYYSDAIPAGTTEEDVSSLEAAVSLPPAEIEQILPSFIESPCPPWAILAFTFTNKAANEIKERLRGVFTDGTTADDIRSGTFHAVCMRILRRDIDRLGYRSDFSIYDTDDTKRLLGDVMKQLGIDEKYLPIKAVAASISAAKDRLISPEAYEYGNDLREKHIAQIYASYQERLRQNNALDFNDIIVKTVELLETEREVADYYQNRFRYVLVDEYQDTNPAQFRLVELLSAKYRNIMVVGDDDQSIYRFRGATVENILRFDRIYTDAKVVKLEQNYRSTRNILAAANAVISHNTDRHEKTLWSAHADGAKIRLLECENADAEARCILAAIMDEVVVRRRRYRDCAVLYRVNALSRELESAFAKGGIPYRIIGGLRFYDRMEVRDMVAYLHVISNPADNLRLRRIINTPRRKIGVAAVEALDALSAQTGLSYFTLMERCDEYPIFSKVAPRFREFTAMIHELRDNATDVSELIRAVYRRTGYEMMLTAEGEAARERIENIGSLISAAAEYERRNEEASLAGFLEEVALVSDIDKYDESADAVVMMTVHSAKGLEFPVVFLAGMEEGLFPGTQNFGDHEGMSEERRLAYVAITRAKEELIVTAAHERMLYGRTVANEVSRFIAREIPPELIERNGSGTARRGQTYGQSYGQSYSQSYGQNRSASGSNPRPRAAVSDEFLHRASFAAPPSRPIRRQAPYAVGTRVRHNVFGEGEVTAVRPMGSDTLYTVHFDDGKTKLLTASYAKLEKIG